ncbi:hypothetical protein Hanom_Chr15g01396871 [Helianthus anomalus]
MQSSLVGNVQVNQSFEKEGYGKVDGCREGDVLSHTISKGYTGNGTNFNEEAKGNVHLEFRGGLYFQEWRKVGWPHPNGKFVNKGDCLDSSETERPNKRNRAQISKVSNDVFNFRAQEAVNSDLFSLNQLLDQVNKEKVEKGIPEAEFPSVPIDSLPQPKDLNFDLNNMASSSISGGVNSNILISRSSTGVSGDGVEVWPTVKVL